MVTETKDNGKKILKLGNWQVFLLGKLHDLYLKNEQCNITLKFDSGESIQVSQHITISLLLSQLNQYSLHCLSLL